MINYLLSKTPHAPYLVTSIRSLRKHYSGPIRLHVWESGYHHMARHSHAIADRIARDDNQIEVRPRTPVWRGRGINAGYVDKIHMMRYSEGLLLDADTLVMGPLDELFKAVEEKGMVVAQFTNWNTLGSKMQHRIKKLRNFSKLDQALIERVLSQKYPALNVGVCGKAHESEAFEEWARWTEVVAREILIPDEIAIQPLQARYVPQGQMAIVSGRYNWSARVNPKIKVLIWHGHGQCWAKPHKSPLGHALWWPRYEQAMKDNWGGIREWRHQVQNPWINKVEQERGYNGSG